MDLQIAQHTGLENENYWKQKEIFQIYLYNKRGKHTEKQTTKYSNKLFDMITYMQALI
jgi:hypothetical protein